VSSGFGCNHTIAVIDGRRFHWQKRQLLIETRCVNLAALASPDLTLRHHAAARAARLENTPENCVRMRGAVQQHC